MKPDKEDLRKYNRGHVGKAGRKPKSEEQKLIEKLTPLQPIAFEAFKKALEEGKSYAVRLFMQYRYGFPKQSLDVNGHVDSVEQQTHYIDYSKISTEALKEILNASKPYDIIDVT